MGEAHTFSFFFATFFFAQMLIHIDFQVFFVNFFILSLHSWEEAEIGSAEAPPIRNILSHLCISVL